MSDLATLPALEQLIDIQWPSAHLESELASATNGASDATAAARPDVYTLVLLRLFAQPYDKLLASTLLLEGEASPLEADRGFFSSLFASPSAQTQQQQAKAAATSLVLPSYSQAVLSAAAALRDRLLAVPARSRPQLLERMADLVDSRSVFDRGTALALPDPAASFSRLLVTALTLAKREPAVIALASPAANGNGTAAATVIAPAKPTTVQDIAQELALLCERARIIAFAPTPNTVLSASSAMAAHESTLPLLLRITVALHPSNAEAKAATNGTAIDVTDFVSRKVLDKERARSALAHLRPVLTMHPGELVRQLLSVRASRELRELLSSPQLRLLAADWSFWESEAQRVCIDEPAIAALTTQLAESATPHLPAVAALLATTLVRSLSVVPDHAWSRAQTVDALTLVPDATVIRLLGARLQAHAVRVDAEAKSSSEDAHTLTRASLEPTMSDEVFEQLFAAYVAFACVGDVASADGVAALIAAGLQTISRGLPRKRERMLHRAKHMTQRANWPGLDEDGRPRYASVSSASEHEHEHEDAEDEDGVWISPTAGARPLPPPPRREVHFDDDIGRRTRDREAREMKEKVAASLHDLVL